MNKKTLYQKQCLGNYISFYLRNYDIIEKNNGKKTFSVRYINIRTKNGVVMMIHERVNHKLSLKEDSICKNFWEEFAKRGFSMDYSNDGVYYANSNESKLIKDNNGVFELLTGLESKINIVSAQNFMQTIIKIEGMVKYKLFE